MLPWQLMLRWRKYWCGPLAVRSKLYCPLGRIEYVRTSRYASISVGEWRWRWPRRSRGWQSALAQWHCRWRLGLALTRVLQLEVWRGQLELGLSDPDWTGIALGCITALPPVWAQRIRLTFEREGGRSWGQAVWRGRPLMVALYLAWHYRLPWLGRR
ncbi:MAG: hypothetical protein AAGB13_12325 [Cyanobacteria bacterium P01_F01_bin.33]